MERDLFGDISFVQIGLSQIAQVHGMLVLMNHTSIRPYFLALLITLLTVTTFYLMQPFVIALALAGIFSVILSPLYKRIAAPLKSWRGLAALLTILIGIIVLAIPFSFLSVKLFDQGQHVYNYLSSPESAKHLQSSLAGLGNHLDRISPGAGTQLRSVSFNVSTYSHEALGWLYKHAGSAFTTTIHAILSIFIFFISLYYLLKEGPNTRRAIIRLSPLTEEETHTLLNRLTRTIDSVVRGHLTIAVVQGILTGIGFTIFGIPNSLFWGVCAGFSALIPGIGTSLVLVPGIIYLFAVGHTGNGIGLTAWSIAIVGTIDNFLNPLLVGTRAAIHPLLILLSVLGGIALYGPAGIFLGPLTISLLIGLLSIYAPAEEKK